MEVHVNPKRIAKLLRERAALDLELAEAFEEVEPRRPRKRPTPEPRVTPAQSTIDAVRRRLRSKGVAA